MALMPAKVRTRRDPRREATRTALIEKAEALIAEHGVDGVSPRQIGAAIGSANNNVVSYHFGGMEELISAVYHYRLPGIETRRAELLAELDAQGRGAELRGLVDALWRPLFEQRGEDGKHSYVAFLAGLARSGRAWTRFALLDEYPVVMEIVNRVRPQLPPDVQPHFRQRLIIIAAMISNSLATMDQLVDECRGSDAVFADLVAMATAALISERG